MTVCGLGSLAIARISGATSLTKGSNVPDSVVPTGTFTTGPFDSGQSVNVVIPANTVLNPNQKIYILECAAPNGVDPTTIDECDGNTNYASGTIDANSDGSVNITAAGKKPYVVYALPDHYTLGEETANGASCGVGAANECVLYIGQGGGSDIGLSDPYFFSQPFQVHSDPTDSGTSDPGDGSPAPVSVVSPTLSTVTPESQTAAADGADPATINVTLNDTSGVGVAGKAVSLTASGGHSTIVPDTAGGVTDASGDVSFTVTDTTPESLTYTAEDTTDSITLTAVAQVTFEPETVSPTRSTLQADPTSVPADGATASTITVTLYDQPLNGGAPQLVAGQTVSLSAEEGSSVVTPASSVTNASGVATFSVTDTQSEVVTYKATDTTGSVTLSSTATVTFGTPAPPSASASTITADPSPAFTGAGGGTTVTVTLLSSGEIPVEGKSVTLSVTSESGKASVSGNPQVTGSNGEATFTVADSTAETVSISAVDTTDADLKLDKTLSVVFETPPPPTISAQNSQASVSGSGAIADGLSAAVVQVTIVNTDGDPVAGVTVTIPNPDGTTIVTASTASEGGAAPGVTDAQGQTTFLVHDTVAETVSLTVTAGGVTLTTHPMLTFIAGSANGSASTISASPLNPAANGTASSTVTVTLTDYFGNPVAGKSISLTQGSASSVITPVQVSGSSALPGVTAANGVALFSVTDATTEVVTYSATDTSDNLALTKQVVVTFGTPPPVKPVMADSDAVCNASKVPADGKTDATITIELRDANGGPVEGKTVSLSASGGSSVIKAASASGPEVTPAVEPTAVPHSTSKPLVASATVVTNSSGDAVFDATDTVPETVTYTADDQTDSMSGWKVTVTFVAAAVTTTTTTTTTTAAAAPTVVSAGTSSSADEGSTGSTGSSGATDTGTSGTSNPDLAFTGAPNDLPWLVGVGVLLLLIGILGRWVLLVRRRKL